MTVLFSIQTGEFLPRSATGKVADVHCSQCDTAFHVEKVDYYNNYCHNFRTDSTFSTASNWYPDLQFFRFCELCIKCREPFVDEGNFVESLDEKDLIEQGLGVGLPKCITPLIFEYYEKRKFPEYKQYAFEGHGSFFPTVPSYTNIMMMFDNKDVMSIPGVEHIFRGANGSIAVKLDMRWWRPRQCTCTRLPFCECICMAAQNRNISKKLEGRLVVRKNDDEEVL